MMRGPTRADIAVPVLPDLVVTLSENEPVCIVEQEPFDVAYSLVRHEVAAHPAALLSARLARPLGRPAC